MSKYNSKGKRSNLELNYGEYLKSRGKIVEEQPEYILQEAFEFEGKKIRAIKFTPDFFLPEGTTFVDFKGKIDNVYPIKKKLFQKKYGFRIREVGTIPIYLQCLMFVFDKSITWNCPYATFELKKFIKRVRINKSMDRFVIHGLLNGHVKYNHVIEAWDLEQEVKDD